MLRILDTDHVSLLEREQPLIVERFNRYPVGKTVITVITWEEQMRGRLNVIRQATSSEQRISAYTRLGSTIRFLQDFPIINFDTIADNYYLELQRQKVRIGTQDLRIASIALSCNAVVVTRNQRDFAKVPNLILEDWTVA
ncbi:type II toxin-antitoxin system VapC family toxin [Kamptonema sp. UHCC 0994]|uniref:type II toxin-antitoxin system VapC family toxin n=1 Tax=Kamptonema sp. UHCC 0994 TaxID=3031329 RepID=UPI0023B9E30F|nr:type II toxin-antitoxin system VapC family toxin [Kamptonema sp. UHCC 0994]MDF0552071.1 type II toxin-antitoxin system VapC family toxin [Kamptonema sp. UHCC 0994]